jgi:hypothetical protein
MGKLAYLNKSRRTRYIAWSALCIALVGCKTVNTDIQIESKPATVWKILSNASGFQDWNPVHVKIEGEFHEGAKVKIHLKDPDGKITVFPAEVRRMVPERELNQGGGTPGIFTFNHTFRLEPAENGTRLIHREEFRGIGVPFFNLGWVDESYNRVNRAIKERAEAMAR